MDTAVTTTDRTTKSGEVTISCQLDEVPAFVEAELVRLYHTLHSSLPFFKVFRSAEKLGSYVAWRDNQPIIVLVFQFGNGRVDVLNEMIEIDHAELHRFAHYMFANHALLNIISFKALKADTRGFPFPVQKSNAKDTYVISLPATAKDYTATLGKSTRAGIKNKMNKVVRDHPSFISRFYVNEEIEAQHIREILKLSEARISRKTLKFSHDEERIITLAKIYGFVHVLLIDGKVCAGSVNYLVGSSCFGEAIGQDPAYEKYGLGTMTVYLTICESIVRGSTRFYLGGGRFDFKSRMLGVRQEMDRLEIYRSYGQLALNFDQVAKAAFDGNLRRLKAWLRKHEDKPAARFVFNSFYRWKSLRNKGR